MRMREIVGKSMKQSVRKRSQGEWKNMDTEKERKRKREREWDRTSDRQRSAKRAIAKKSSIATHKRPILSLTHCIHLFLFFVFLYGCCGCMALVLTFSLSLFQWLCVCVNQSHPQFTSCKYSRTQIHQLKICVSSSEYERKKESRNTLVSSIRCVANYMHIHLNTSYGRSFVSRYSWATFETVRALSHIWPCSPAA